MLNNIFKLIISHLLKVIFLNSSELRYKIYDFFQPTRLCIMKLTNKYLKCEKESITGHKLFRICFIFLFYKVYSYSFMPIFFSRFHLQNMSDRPTQFLLLLTSVNCIYFAIIENNDVFICGAL